MSISQYPKRGYFLVAQNSSLELGRFDNATWGDLSLAHLRVFHKRTGAYSYQMRLVISSKEGGPSLVASDYIDFSDATTGQSSACWLGDVTFSFPEYRLVDGEEYFARLEATGYSRSPKPNQNDYYLSVWCDWYEPVGSNNSAGARVAFGVKR